MHASMMEYKRFMCHHLIPSKRVQEVEKMFIEMFMTLKGVLHKYADVLDPTITCDQEHVAF